MERQEIERAEEIYEQADVFGFVSEDTAEQGTSGSGGSEAPREDGVQEEGMIRVEDIEIGE